MWELPDLDTVAVPLHSIDPSSVCIEWGSVSYWTIALDAAAIVASAGPAVRSGSESGARLASGTDTRRAAGSSVQCYLIVIVEVHTLDNVDFTLIGPVGANHPTTIPISNFEAA